MNAIYLSDQAEPTPFVPNPESSPQIDISRIKVTPPQSKIFGPHPKTEYTSETKSVPISPFRRRREKSAPPPASAPEAEKPSLPAEPPVPDNSTDAPLPPSGPQPPREDAQLSTPAAGDAATSSRVADAATDTRAGAATPPDSNQESRAAQVTGQLDLATTEGSNQQRSRRARKQAQAAAEQGSKEGDTQAAQGAASEAKEDAKPSPDQQSDNAPAPVADEAEVSSSEAAPRKGAALIKALASLWEQRRRPLSLWREHPRLRTVAILTVTLTIGIILASVAGQYVYRAALSEPGSQGRGEESVPASGATYTDAARTALVAPMEITGHRKKHGIIKLIRIRSKSSSPVVTVFVRAGGKITVQVPFGDYYAKCGIGNEWQGHTRSFGPDGVYYQGREKLEFWASKYDKKIHGVTFDVDAVEHSRSYKKISHGSFQ